MTGWTLADRRRPGSRYFWLVNDGNPANFLHGAVIGPAIQLIGKKMAALVLIASAPS